MRGMVSENNRKERIDTTSNNVLLMVFTLQRSQQIFQSAKIPQCKRRLPNTQLLKKSQYTHVFVVKAIDSRLFWGDIGDFRSNPQYLCYKIILVKSFLLKIL